MSSVTKTVSSNEKLPGVLVKSGNSKSSFKNIFVCLFRNNMNLPGLHHITTPAIASSKVCHTKYAKISDCLAFVTGKQKLPSK